MTSIDSQFVLLAHFGPDQAPAAHLRPDHWDLMFEMQAALLTLKLSCLPQFDQKGSLQKIKASRSPDHRLHYLGYEGEISGNRGAVTRILKGRFWLRGGHLSPDATVGQTLGPLMNEGLPAGDPHARPSLVLTKLAQLDGNAPVELALTWEEPTRPGSGVTQIDLGFKLVPVGQSTELTFAGSRRDA